MNINKMLIDEIRIKGGIWITVHGDSMLPLIANGQKVYLVSRSKYSIGDIIAYNITTPSDENHIIVHRVVLVRKTYILTKGDNNSYIDPIKIQCDNIIGLVTSTCLKE